MSSQVTGSELCIIVLLRPLFSAAAKGCIQLHYLATDREQKSSRGRQVWHLLLWPVNSLLAVVTSRAPIFISTYKMLGRKFDDENKRHVLETAIMMWGLRTQTSMRTVFTALKWNFDWSFLEDSSKKLTRMDSARKRILGVHEAEEEVAFWDLLQSKKKFDLRATENMPQSILVRR